MNNVKQPMDMIHVLMLSPALNAVSGVSTHTNLLFQSALGNELKFSLFQVGSEGRRESPFQRIVRLLLTPLHLAIAIARLRPSIVHINTALDSKAYWRDIWYVAVSRLCGRKIIFQIHGGSLPGEFFARSRLLTWILRRVLQATDVLVLISKVEYDAYRVFAPGARAELIPNAIPVEGLLAADASKAQHQGPLHLVYLGRLVASKGVQEVVEAVRLLRARAVPIRLSIAGSGPIEAVLRRIIAESALEDLVTLRGPLFGDEKNALWHAADVFVFPTYHKEGLPYSLLEAMAAAVVPVISPIGGIPDVMCDGVHGFFVPPKDPERLADIIASLHSDRPLVAKLAMAARQRICSSYTVDRLTDDFRRLYATLR